MALTEKSFTTGADFPAQKEGTLRLYSNRFCPFAHRPRLVLAYKGVEYETVNIHLKQKPAWFLEKNPLGLVPALEKDGKVLSESLVVSDFLDDVFANNRLTPSDPYRKAKDAMLVDFFGNKFLAPYYKLYKVDPDDLEAKEALQKALERLEAEVGARGTFFGGDQVAMIDLMFWPWFERIGILSIFSSLAPSSSTLPKLTAWMESMRQRPEVKATALNKDVFVQYYSTHMEGKPNYDLGLQL